MHTFENFNIVLTRTPTDADANAWLTTYSTAQVKEPKNSLLRISAFRELP